MPAKKKQTEGPSLRPRRRRKPAASRGLSVADLGGELPDALKALSAKVESDGGKPIAGYRDPFGGQGILLALLPIDRVQPTPFQRDLSKPHVARLENVISKIGLFLDPIIAFRLDDGSYVTPNGHHRLAAMRELSAKAISALIVPDPSVVYKILALNVEKAHTLREKASEVVRMARGLSERGSGLESAYALEFEEPSYLTLGLCYEEKPGFAGGAYQPLLRRVEAFLEAPLGEALHLREERAKALLALDDLVGEKVEALKARGLTSPFLRAFVVARINPLRFRSGKSAALSFDETLAAMRRAIERFDPGRIRQEEIVRAGGGAPEES